MDALHRTRKAHNSEQEQKFCALTTTTTCREVDGRRTSPQHNFYFGEKRILNAIEETSQ